MGLGLGLDLSFVRIERPKTPKSRSGCGRELAETTVRGRGVRRGLGMRGWSGGGGDR